MQKSKGVHAKAGYHDVVLDADLAGILAHEAIGHTTEADLVMGCSWRLFKSKCCKWTCNFNWLC